MSNATHTIKVKISVLIFLLAFLSSCDNRNAIKKPNNNTLDTSKNAFPYRIINAPDSSRYLIAYEFHTGNSNDGMYLECSAVIKSIDPTKDDYKTICRSVVADIVKTTGTDNIEILVYDNYEAFVLAELKFGQQYKVLNKSETDTVDRHKVADYYGEMRGSESTDNHTLWFYPQSNNRFTEKEVYEPSGSERKGGSYTN